MGHVDLKTLQIALSLVKQENFLITKVLERGNWGLLFFKMTHTQPLSPLYNNVGRVFPEFSPSFSFG